MLAAHVVLLAGLPMGVRAADRAARMPTEGRLPVRVTVRPLAPDPTAAAPSLGGSTVDDAAPARIRVQGRTPEDQPRRPPNAAAIPAAQPTDPAIPASQTVTDADATLIETATGMHADGVVQAPAGALEAAGLVSAAPAASDLPAEASDASHPQAPASLEAEPRLLASAATGKAAAAAPPAAGGPPPPIYPTRLPQPAVLHYELRRGVLTGVGELVWQPTAQGYDMRIDGTVFGLPVLSWASRGGFDAAGLAPLRFTDKRRGKDLRAANFQRDKGLISWSSVTTESPLAAGAQDRLSWMVQLAAIVQAERSRYKPGAQVVMQVAGARGDVDVWTFSVTAREAVDVIGGVVPDTLALRREPRKPFDTQVEVWLDPARQHLPVRLKLSSAGGDDALEFLLKP